jgi:putative ABC transport system permease protein
VLARVQAMPGVRAAGITTTLPLQGDGWGDPLVVRGQPGEFINVVVRSRRVTADVFAALGVPLLAGRLLQDDDERALRNVAVIDQALADAYFPDGNAIGQMVREIGGEGDEWFEIVGVVGNTATHSLDEAAPLPKLYMPLQTARTADSPGIHTASFVIRSDASADALLPAVWSIVRQVDPALAIASAETLDEMRARAAAGTAFTMLLLVIASLMALLLGVVGVYAVIAYTVAQRTAEIGVRIALGAAPAAVAGMIVRQSAATIAIGVVVGLAGAAAATRALQSLLFGVHARDPVTFAAVAALLFVVGLAASWIPARRAARVSPRVSLQG